MKMLLYILCQLYLTLWNFGGKSECTPCLSFLNYSSLQKDKYIYTFILFRVLTTSHPSRRSGKNKNKSTLVTKLVRKIISLNVKNYLESCVQACMSRSPRWSGQTLWYLYDFVLPANMYAFSSMEGFPEPFTRAFMLVCINNNLYTKFKLFI